AARLSAKVPTRPGKRQPNIISTTNTGANRREFLSKRVKSLLALRLRLIAYSVLGPRSYHVGEGLLHAAEVEGPRHQDSQRRQRRDDDNRPWCRVRAKQR